MSIWQRIGAPGATTTMNDWQSAQSGSDPTGGYSPVVTPPEAAVPTNGVVGTPTGPTGMKDTDLPNKGANLTERQKAENRRQVADWELEIAKAEVARLKAAKEDVNNPSVFANAVQAERDKENARNSAANEVQQQKTAEEKPARAPAGTDAGFTDEVVETGQGKRRIRRFFKWDGYGNKVPDSARGDKGLEDLGAAESATDVQTAGVNLQTAQLQLQKAQNDFALATSPEAKREAKLKLDLAEFNLQQARTKAEREDRPSILSGVPENQEWILSRDPVSGAITRERNPAYRAPVGQIIQPGTGRVITTRDPVTGEIKTEPNPTWTPELEEAERLQLENLRRGTLPSNALAALQQETTRLQGRAAQERDRLVELQRTGAITAADADRQFKEFFRTVVEAPLAGLRTQAEEAQRLERTQVEERNRLEGIRADTANRAREQLGYQAGETARSQIMQIAPEVRTQGFLTQYGNMVGNMAARANAPTAEAANALPAAPTITGDTFSIDKFAGAIPNLDEAAKQATARALAGISPTAARLANMPQVNMPTGPDLQGLLNQIPYTGQLQRPPPGLQPLPNFAALDQGNGMARSIYPGVPGVNGGQGGWMDWAINAPPFGG
jgi:hypothetical protein